MQVVKIDIYPLVDAHPHRRESLRGQTVCPLGIRARRPLGPHKVGKLKVRKRIQSGTDRRTARGGSAVGMVVGFVDVRMVVEVLFRQ
jgi:hypothetical protein